ncbi:unnamed protein product, partial [Mesorhabditis belari]|uniref:Uncharacterized protein n=1 Tax=Mesorhabditis belari TaxID=2138241 RepID=A0AAF3F0Z0_9BILA
MEFSDVTCRVECLESVGETYIGTLLIGNDFLNITDCHDETKNFGVPTAAFCLEPNSVRNWRALRLKPVETVFGPEDAEIKQVSFQHEDPDTMRTMQVVFEGCHLGGEFKSWL